MTTEYAELLETCRNLELDCVRTRKTINYCLRRFNRGLSINAKAMDADVEKEMRSYIEKESSDTWDSYTPEELQEQIEALEQTYRVLTRKMAEIIIF